MATSSPVTRRNFLKQTAVGAAAVSTISGAPAILAQRNPMDMIGVACIGVGTKGYRNLKDAQVVPNTEIRVICDLYDGNINRALSLCDNPNVQVIREWEKAVEAPGIDVVIISTPDFWHAAMTIAAAEAHKDIYVEKGWCTNLADAKKMRHAVKDNQVVMQLGHHYNSGAAYHRAREIFQSGALGKVPLIRTYIDRAGANPFWKFYTDYNIHQAPKDASPKTIDWDRFVANANKRKFDIDRFFTWRRYWDYGTGIAGDLMSHLWDGVNMVVGMGIPETAVTQGGIYYWQDGREVPDIWEVTFNYPAQDLIVTFGACSHSAHIGEITHFLGREMSMEVSERFCRTYDAEWKPEYGQKRAKARELAEKLGLAPHDAVVPPDYSIGRNDGIIPTTHMRNFLDCVRSRALPRCHVDRAFEEAATIMLSVEAYRRDRKVRWDAATEEILNTA